MVKISRTYNASFLSDSKIKKINFCRKLITRKNSSFFITFLGVFLTLLKTIGINMNFPFQRGAEVKNQSITFYIHSKT